MRALALAFAVCSLVACDKHDRVSVDNTRLGIEIPQRETAAMASPKVDAAMNDMFAALAKEPALAVAGTKLAGQLSDDPVLQKAGESVLGVVTTAPEVQAFIMKLMADHPGATPDQIGTLTGAKFETITNSPEVNPAFQAAFGDMANSLHVRSRFDAVFQKAGDRLDAYVGKPERQARWSVRLRELNGGSDPDTATATQLYLDHAWTSDRMVDFFVKFLGNPVVRTEAASTLADIIADPDFAKQIQVAADAIATDPEVQSGVAKLFVLLVKDPIPGAELRAQLHELLTNKTVTASLDKLAGLLFDDPKIAAAVRVHFDKLTADPGLRAQFDELIDKW